MMKIFKNFRQYFVVSAMSLTLLLSGCGSTDNTAGGADDGNGSSSAPTESVTLSVSHFLPPAHFLHAEVIEPFTEEISELTDGRIQFDIFAAGALGSPEAQYDMAESGVADITISLQGYTPGKFPLSSVTELPFIALSAEMGTNILWELYQSFPELQEEYNQTKLLALFANDAEHIMTTNQPIHSIDDINGLRLRTASNSENNTVEAWGGSPSFMPMSDVYDAAQRGVIDGMIAPLSTIQSFSLADVTGNIIEPPFSITHFFMTMNKQAWNNLSAEDQAIFEEVSEKYRVKAAQRYDEAGRNGKQIALDNNVEVITLPEDEWLKFRDALQPLHEKWVNDMENRGLPGKAVYDEATRLSESYQ